MAELARMIADQAITHLLCLPSLHDLLLTYALPAQLAALCTVIVAGEACPRRLAQRHLAVLPHVPLFNEYGPTEATVWCTVYRIPPELPPGTVAIGRPIANLRVYVLDPAGEHVPIGAVGELYVGGKGVAAGYLGQPELTQARFVAARLLDAGAAGVGDQLYRTGDLVRFRAGGVLEYWGRQDQQVKIRGHRIELEEIERVLAEQPGIREVAVAVRTPPARSAPAGAPATSDDLVQQLAGLDAATREQLLAEVARITEDDARLILAGHESR
jgi:non-ribosomal peptide synthetase component F